MADVKFSEFTAATEFSTGDYIVGLQSGANVKFPHDVIKPYKSWVGILTQQATDAPTAIVLQNELGGTIVFTRVSTGSYRATLSSAFTADKTVVLPGTQLIFNGATFDNAFFNINSTSQIVIATQRDHVSTDGLMTSLAVEIRVYY